MKKKSGIHFDLPRLKEKIRSYDVEMSDPSFWDNPDKAREISQKATEAKDTYDTYTRLFAQAEGIQELLDMAIEEDDESMEPEIKAEIDRIGGILREKEIELLLSGKYDTNNAIVTFHAGAGGTEAQDWTEMLIRMYIKWAESKGFEIEELNMLPGDEAGIKSAEYMIRGRFAYGLLKSEKGVHRLVRISPFVAQCQSQRSQHQNKEQCLRLLRAKLYELELEKREKEKQAIDGEQQAIEWGSQIRSYVFQPYTLVKDNRTGVETGNIQAVMDGGLDPFIEGFLKHSKLHK